MKKKVDSRIRTLIENNVKLNHRSFFVIVGDNGRNQIVNLHYMLSKAVIKARPSVLWCYKKDLGFSSHRKKRMKKIKKMISRGQLDPDKDDPFELFVSATDIRYTYYHDTQKILGQQFGMLVLQDFEALTPNLLARTVETVEGGGVIVLLLKSMSSLKSLYTMSMDVHSRFRTASHQEVVPRFNERFLLSLSSCDSCLVVDDELNVLPISTGARRLSPLPEGTAPSNQAELEELATIKESLARSETESDGKLVEVTKTADQASAVMTFIQAISEKTLRSTVALTAGRGRGKSAALGLAMAAAISYGYSNIFVTSPSPENLKTVFEFVCRGFDSLGYQEKLDYELIQSSNPDFNKAVIRVNVHRLHRQTIQYISPEDSAKLGQAELVVIDEAAAIPLPLVRALLGNYLVFMASTINGYEGTGRSLSLKLIESLRKSSALSANPVNIHNVSGKAAASSGSASVDSSSLITSATARTLREVDLEEPIRYSPGDQVESWLNQLLCLDATIETPEAPTAPLPTDCELYYVNRDTLFSYHKASEHFLQQMMALYVSSHYKNTPNDLQLMSDAPAHHLFVLLGPVAEGSSAIPEVLCVLQVCLEGQINRESVLSSLSQGRRAAGDLIPWLMSQQYQDSEFPSLSGARVVRIATHPDYARKGYGSVALEQLSRYYQGLETSLDDDVGEHKGKSNGKERLESVPSSATASSSSSSSSSSSLLVETLKPRKNLPPLLSKLGERPAERLDWLGVSYGLTASLHRFWSKSGYEPVYLRLTPNDLTGEHTCVMLKPLESETAASGWLKTFVEDFRRRFMHLLSLAQLSHLQSSLILSILSPTNVLDSCTTTAEEEAKAKACAMTAAELEWLFTSYDLKRLDAYSSSLVDYHVILDLVPRLAVAFFSYRLHPVRLSPAQATILIGIGLKHMTTEGIANELNLPVSQTLALFNKVIRKLSSHLKKLQEAAVGEQMWKDSGATAADAAAKLRPVAGDLDSELAREGKKVVNNLLLGGEDLSQFQIEGDDEEWEKAKIGEGGVVSIKGIAGKQSKKKRKFHNEDEDEGKEDNDGKKKRSKKKRKSGGLK